MAGRKRKVRDLVAVAATHKEAGLTLRENQTEPICGASPIKLKSQPGPCESVQSHYFNNSEPDQRRLEQEFFNQPCICLAKAFIGKVLVRRCADGSELRGRIVETEAYLGGEDKASHSAGENALERNTAMFMKPGTIYVYPIYGIYLCMNVSSEGEGAAVLLRSLEPCRASLR